MQFIAASKLSSAHHATRCTITSTFATRAGQGAAGSAAHYAQQYQEGDALGNIAMRADGGAVEPGGQHVFAVTLVKAGCFYGYNATEEPFLRVCLCACWPCALGRLHAIHIVPHKLLQAGCNRRERRPRRTCVGGIASEDERTCWHDAAHTWPSS